MNRQQHLEWCKKSAHEYLARGDVHSAITSMLSDLQKHPETKLDNGSPLYMLGMMTIVSGDIKGAKSFIDGFN